MATAAIVVDSISGQPLPKASVFDCNGQLAGLCSDNGRMPAVPESSYPLTVRYVGYAPRIVTDRGTDSITMSEIVSELPEVIVNSDRQMALHLLGYVREYSTLTTYTDTVSLFREKTVDFMLPTRSVKKFSGWNTPRMLSGKSYYRFINSSGLDSVSDKFPEHFTWADWIGVIKNEPIPESMVAIDAGTDTIKGRQSTSRIWRKLGEHMYLDVNIMSDTLNRRFIPQLAGLVRDDIDFRRFDIHYTFDNVFDNAVTADNLSAMSFNIESQGRGRNLRRLFNTRYTPYVETYVELYIIDKEYIPIKEARKWEKFPERVGDIGIIMPDGLPPLSESTCELIARVDGIDTDRIRLETKPDTRIGHVSTTRWDILYRLKRMFGGFIGLNKPKPIKLNNRKN